MNFNEPNGSFYFGLLTYLNALADNDVVGTKNAEAFMVNAALAGYN